MARTKRERPLTAARTRTKRRTIEDELAPGPWFGQTKVAFLNSDGDLVLQCRKQRGNTPRKTRFVVESSRIVTGTDAEKIEALHAFRPDDIAKRDLGQVAS